MNIDLKASDTNKDCNCYKCDKPVLFGIGFDPLYNFKEECPIEFVLCGDCLEQHQKTSFQRLLSECGYGIDHGHKVFKLSNSPAKEHDKHVVGEDLGNDFDWNITLDLCQPQAPLARAPAQQHATQTCRGQKRKTSSTSSGATPCTKGAKKSRK